VTQIGHPCVDWKNIKKDSCLQWKKNPHARCDVDFDWMSR